MQDNIKNIDKILSKFIQCNGEDVYYANNVSFKLEEWINNTDDIEVKNILLELFSHFKIFNRNEVKVMLKELLEECLKEVNIDSTNICYLPSSDSGKYNGSSELTCLIREIDRETNNSYLYDDTIVTGLEYIYDDINSILFFDDISGTGRTITKFLKKNKGKFEGKKIYINLLAITQIAKANIDDFRKDNPKLDITIKYKHEYNKAFEGLCKLDEIHRDKLYDFEKKILGKGNDFILGYKDSQLLIGFYSNVPNNTISSFWLDSDWVKNHDNWKPLFGRYRAKTRKRRKNQNKNVAALGG